MSAPLGLITAAATALARGGLIDALKVPGIGLSLVILLLAGLFVALGGVRYLLKLVPMSKARRAKIWRALPAIEELPIEFTAVATDLSRL